MFCLSATIVEYVSLYNSWMSLCFITAIFLSFSRMFLFIFVTFVLLRYFYIFLCCICYIYRPVYFLFDVILINNNCPTNFLCSLFIFFYFNFNVYFLHNFCCLFATIGLSYLFVICFFIYLLPSFSLSDRLFLCFCYLYLWENVCNLVVQLSASKCVLLIYH